MSASAPDAAYMAKILGLTDKSPLTKLSARMKWDTMCHSTPIPQLSNVFRDFSATYLPALMDEFETGSTSHATLCSDVMRAISRNVHWGRFQTTHPRGRAILLEHARRISSTARTDPGEDQSAFSSSVMLLWQLLAWDGQWGPTRVPNDIAKNIIRMIREFLRESPGAMGTSIAEDCMNLLKGRDEQCEFRVNMQKAQWEMEISACFCGVNDGLLRCSKCKIVAYCSPAHQSADWSRHKKRCIKPVFDA